MAEDTIRRHEIFFDQIRDVIREQSEVADSLRLLSSFWDLPLHLNLDASEEVKNVIDGASCFLPSLLNLMADAIEVRNTGTRSLVDRFEKSLQPSVELTRLSNKFFERLKPASQ